MKWLYLIVGLFLTPLSAASKADEIKADVAVYGATEGGIAATVTLSRLGHSVVLVEPTDYIGGMSTSGAVPNMDGNLPPHDFGFYGEFARRIKKHYQRWGLSTNTCYIWWGQNHLCFEPHIGKKVFEEFIKESANIQLYTLYDIADIIVSKSDSKKTRVLGFTAKNLKTGQVKSFKAKMSLDASEFGDLMAKTPVNYRVGKSPRAKSKDTDCVQDITYAAVIRKYKKLPDQFLIKNAPPGYNGRATGQLFGKKLDLPVAEYFKRFVKNGGSNRGGTYPMSFAGHNAYRGLPDSNWKVDYSPKSYKKISKTSINLANDFPFSVSGIENSEKRKELICQAKLKTIQFIYYLQQELGFKNWSVSMDEGYQDSWYNNNIAPCTNIPANLKAIEQHMPPKPYIRESRRLDNGNIYTAEQVQNRLTYSTASDSLVAGGTMIDFHGCIRKTDFASDLEEKPTKYLSKLHPSAPLPFKVFIPKSVTGFLPANSKLLALSRAVNAKFRHQPMNMLVGQAAAGIASQSIKSNRDPADVDVLRVQEILIRQNISPLPFDDLGPADRFTADIEWLAVKGAMTGYKDRKFYPHQPITRKQMATVIMRLSGVKRNSKVIIGREYSDLRSKDQHTKDLYLALTRKLIKPCPQVKGLLACPERPLTRIEVIEIAEKLQATLTKKEEIKRPNLDICLSMKNKCLNTLASRAEAAHIVKSYTANQ